MSVLLESTLPCSPFAGCSSQWISLQPQIAMWPSPCKSTNKHTPDYSIHWQAVKKNKNTKPKETLKPKQLLNKHKEPQKINAQDSWKLIHNVPPRQIFPLPLKGFGHAEHPHAHFITGFNTYWFSLNSWCKCLYFFCRWFLKLLCNLHVDIQCQLIWAELVTNCDQTSDADSVRTPLTSAWRQCCTYINPTTGISGHQCRNC